VPSIRRVGDRLRLGKRVRVLLEPFDAEQLGNNSLGRVTVPERNRGGSSY